MASYATYVIASDRPWNRRLPENLADRCEGRFVLIDNKEGLNSEKLQAIGPRYVFFPHWSYRIPKEIYENFECIIFHMTDLPYGRGGSPLQNLIVRGHSETVMTALRCMADMDAGPVYTKRLLCLHGAAEEIFLRASQLIEEMIEEIVIDDPEPVPQEGEVVTFARRKAEDGDLEQTQDLDELYDFIRMLDADDYPPAFFKIGRYKLEFSHASRRVGRVDANVRITLTEEEEDG